MTTIAHHTLTPHELSVLNAIQSRLDGAPSAPVIDVFPARGNEGNRQRQIVDRLNGLGVLAACEITLVDGVLRDTTTTTASDDAKGRP